mgnify:CR=1 FL=1
MFSPLLAFVLSLLPKVKTDDVGVVVLNEVDALVPASVPFKNKIFSGSFNAPTWTAQLSVSSVLFTIIIFGTAPRWWGIVWPAVLFPSYFIIENPAVVFTE